MLKLFWQVFGTTISSIDTFFLWKLANFEMFQRFHGILRMTTECCASISASIIKYHISSGWMLVFTIKERKSIKKINQIIHNQNFSTRFKTQHSFNQICFYFDICFYLVQKLCHIVNTIVQNNPAIIVRIM